MSESKLEHALTALKQQQDSRTTLKVLISIRKQVEWPRNRDNIIKLRESGCLKDIVQIIQSSQKSVIDVCLSILGNCMMDRGCTRDVIAQYNILSCINQLLKKHGKEDSINGRTFRIIGNMCQHRDQWANIIIDRKPQIVTHIVDCIKKIASDEVPEDEKISDATVLMALKSLRELLNCHTITLLVTKFGVLKAVGCLLIKYSVEWKRCPKKHEKLITDIIKLLQKYSRYKFYDSITEMRNTPKGDSLIHLSEILSLAPKAVVKIIMNFINMSKLKSELPIPEICGKFMEILEQHSIVKEFDGECIEYLQCLCFLLDHPANRNTDRCGKCIPLLIKVLEEFETPTITVLECCNLLLATLNKFKYDDRLLLEQLRCGIVQILTKKLHWLVGASKKLSIKHEKQKKRKHDESLDDLIGSHPWKRHASYGACVKYTELTEPRSPASSEEEFECHRGHCSGKICEHESRAPSPSTSSPESSPARSVFNEYDSEDDYSPVCSEADSSEYPLNISDDVEVKSTCLSEPDDHSAQVEENFVNDDDEALANPSVRSLKTALLLEVVKLLKSYAKLRPVAPNLASEDLLVALLRSSQIFGFFYPLAGFYTVDLIYRLLESHQYLIPLMQTQFAESLYSFSEKPLHTGDKCDECTQFTCVTFKILEKLTYLAESGAGQGDIAHKLIRGDKNVKEHLVLSIPYIVRDRSVLSRFMLKYRGLEVLLQLLKEENDILIRNRGIKVISVLAARKLDIANPKKIKNAASNSKSRKITGTCLSDDAVVLQNVVTFKCEDGSLVNADRDFLIETSEFFSGLLNGHFKESKESEIDLPNVHALSLRCLLNLLRHKCFTERERTSPSVDITDLQLDTMLDVIALSDRFLLVELCLFLTDSVEKFKITSRTVPDIYSWALESGTNLLRVEAVAYALVGDIIESERLKMFQRLFDLGYREELLGDIEKMLLRYLGGAAACRE